MKLACLLSVDIVWGVKNDMLLIFAPDKMLRPLLVTTQTEPTLPINLPISSELHFTQDYSGGERFL